MRIPFVFLFLSGFLTLTVQAVAQGVLIYTPYTISTLESTAAAFETNGVNTKPTGIAVDSLGNAFVTDVFRSVIYKILPTGEMSTIAGGGGFGLIDGTNQNAGFYSPTGLAIDTAGNLYVADTGDSSIRKVAPVGTNWVVTTIGTAFNQPKGIAVDQSGTVYVADTGNSTIETLTPDGTNWVETTIAGMAGQSGPIVDGTNSTARFSEPVSVAVGRNGILFVVDEFNWIVRSITPVGTNWIVKTLFKPRSENGHASDGTNSITPLALNPLNAIAIDSAGNIYTAGYDAIQRVTPFGDDWIGTTLIGAGNRLKDGTGANGWVNVPYGIAVDAAGTLYIADTGNQAIRIARPALQYAVTNNQFVFSWPTTPPGGYWLQSSTSLGTGAVWNPLTNGVVTSGVDFVLTNNIDTNAMSEFFRMAPSQ